MVPKSKSKTKLSELPSNLFLIHLSKWQILLPVAQAKTLTSLALISSLHPVFPHMQSAHPSNYIRTLTISHRLPCYMLPLQSVPNTAEDSDLYTLNQIMALLYLVASHPTQSEPQPSQSPAKPCAFLSQQVFVQISPSQRQLLGLLYLKWNLHIPH